MPLFGRMPVYGHAESRKSLRSSQHMRLDSTKPEFEFAQMSERMSDASMLNRFNLCWRVWRGMSRYLAVAEILPSHLSRAAHMRLFSICSRVGTSGALSPASSARASLDAACRPGIPNLSNWSSGRAIGGASLRMCGGRCSIPKRYPCDSWTAASIAC